MSPELWRRRASNAHPVGEGRRALAAQGGGTTTELSHHRAAGAPASRDAIDDSRPAGRSRGAGRSTVELRARDIRTLRDPDAPQPPIRPCASKIPPPATPRQSVELLRT